MEKRQKVLRFVQSQIDWFKERGFLLGQDKARDIYYIVDNRPGGTGERFDFGSIWQAQMFAERLNITGLVNLGKEG